MKRADIKRCRGLDTLLKMAIIRLECLSFIGLFFKIIYLTILFIHTVFYFKLYLKINKNDRDVFFIFFYFLVRYQIFHLFLTFYFNKNTYY